MYRATQKGPENMENVRKVMRSRLQHYLYKINTYNINAFSDYLHVRRHMLITIEEYHHAGNEAPWKTRRKITEEAAGTGRCWWCANKGGVPGRLPAPESRIQKL